MVSQPTKQGMQVRFLGWGDALEKEMAIHGQRNLTGYSPWGHRRVRRDSLTKQALHQQSRDIQPYHKMKEKEYFPTIIRHITAILNQSFRIFFMSFQFFGIVLLTHLVPDSPTFQGSTQIKQIHKSFPNGCNSLCFYFVHPSMHLYLSLILT